ALRVWLRGSSDPLRRRAARLEIARIQSDELGRPGVAVQELEKAVREQPTDLELRRILATNLREAGHHDDAIKELQRLIHDHPGRAELFRDLAATHRATGDVTAARRALSPLLLLGQATREEQAEVDRRDRRTGRAHPG